MIFRITAVCVALFLFFTGLQLPQFADQYKKRIEAQLVEAVVHMRGFQEIADRFHNGSLEQLIEKHEKSTDKTFQAEAQPLRKMFDRVVMLERERNAMSKGAFNQAWHLLIKANSEIRHSTWKSYKLGFWLSAAGIFSGLGLALAGLGLLTGIYLIYRFASTNNDKPINESEDEDLAQDWLRGDRVRSSRHRRRRTA